MIIESPVLHAKQASRPALVLMFLWISFTATLGQTGDSAARARQGIPHLKTTLSPKGRPKAIELSPDGKTLAISVVEAIQQSNLPKGTKERLKDRFSNIHR